MKKYILGWMTISPGERERFLTEAQWMAEATRAEEGCLFFELNPSFTSPDLVLLMECFEDESAHGLHSKTPHQTWMNDHMKRYVVTARVEIVYSDSIRHHAVDNRPPQA
jgi:quinol monooxygenase YgiN